MRKLLKTTRPKDAKISKIREADENTRNARKMSKGRIIKTELNKVDGEAKGVRTPMSTDTGEVEDDGLGGCKFLRVDPPVICVC